MSYFFLSLLVFKTSIFHLDNFGNLTLKPFQLRFLAFLGRKSYYLPVIVMRLSPGPSNLLLLFLVDLFVRFKRCLCAQGLLRTNGCYQPHLSLTQLVMPDLGWGDGMSGSSIRLGGGACGFLLITL